MYRLKDYDFVQLSKKAKNRRVHKRLLILSHLKEGKNSQETAQAL